MRTLVIAEAGVNHNGDRALARELIDVAAEAGADFVKFQSFNADQLTTVDAQKAKYQTQSGGAGETQRAMLQRLELSRDAHLELRAHCVARGIQFLSTAFDLDSLAFLMELDLPLFKIPSGEITNLPYLRRVGSHGKPIILSTGMSTMDDVARAVAALEAAGAPRTSLTLLHCTSEYPSPLDGVNLRAIVALREAFGVNVGYSDHTLGIEVPLAAVALGATVIEKHFTVSRDLPGPDHPASLEPRELLAMVSSIRNIERAMGDGAKRPTDGELQNRAVVRKSIVAVRPIVAGEPFTDVNIGVKRPGTGLSPMRWDDVIGRPASRDYRVDELIEL